jgi:hypothetical protein
MLKDNINTDHSRKQVARVRGLNRLKFVSDAGFVVEDVEIFGSVYTDLYRKLSI